MSADPFDTIVVTLVVTLKFALPLLILRYPFGAGWANLLLDSVDGDILVPAGLADPSYQLLDKVADYVTYIAMFAWGWGQPIRREITLTFALRSVGQALFLLTRNELALFFFPNLLEPLFLVYVTLGRFRGWDRAYGIYRRHARLIWLGILVYKFQDEWITHVANVDRSSAIRSLFGR